MKTAVEWLVEELTKQNMFMHLFSKEIEQAKAMENKQYTRDEVHMLMCKAFEQGFKKSDVVDAGLESKETNVECAWILTKYDSSPDKSEYYENNN